MGDLFKTLTSGLARFVYAWLMPSVVTAGIFLMVVLPQLPIVADVGLVGGAAAFALAVLSLSIIFAYASRPLYQFFEGYTMPRWMRRPLLVRSRRRYVRLQAQRVRGSALGRQVAAEALMAYPQDLALILPTRLGNALRAMEAYGGSRFGLDSQTFWYELQAVANENVRRSTEEARAAVDFFMSSVGHLLLLCVVSLTLAPVAKNPLVTIIVSASALLLAWAAYGQAVRNVGEWRYAVQALVNMSRPALARALGLAVPPSHADEYEMWQAYAGLVHNGARQRYLRVLDPLRQREDTSTDAR